MEKLDLKLGSLTLSTRTYNALIIGFWNLYRKESKDITIRDLVSLNYDQIKSFRNIGKKGLSELLIEVHNLGLRFDFEMDDRFFNNLKPIKLEDYLLIKKKYLMKIKNQEEKISMMQEELEQLKLNMNNIDEMILKLK